MERSENSISWRALDSMSFYLAVKPVENDAIINTGKEIKKWKAQNVVSQPSRLS